MCTLTIFKLDDERWLVTMNRDEALERLEGEPVTAVKNNQLHSWRPVDQRAGGSWFGIANGRAFALLNRYQDTERLNTGFKNTEQNNPLGAMESRGRLIEELLLCEGEGELKSALNGFERRLFAPFDLWVLDVNGEAPQLTCLTWTGVEWRTDRVALEDAFFYTSSSVDYEDVKVFRLGEFNKVRSLVGGGALNAEVVLRMHKAVYHKKPSWGFNMQRAGRHSKSICQAVLAPNSFEVEYMSAPFK